MIYEFFWILVFPFVIFWFTGIIIAFFHKGIGILWKIFILILFLLFVLINYPYLQKDFFLWKNNFREQILTFFDRLLEIFQILILIYWPVLLYKAFFSIKERHYQYTIILTVIFTFLIWILYFIRTYYKDSIMKAFMEIYKFF